MSGLVIVLTLLVNEEEGHRPYLSQSDNPTKGTTVGVERGRFAGGVLGVVEERAECRTAQGGAGIGHTLHELLKVELGGEDPSNAVERRSRPGRRAPR